MAKINYKNYFHIHNKYVDFKILHFQYSLAKIIMVLLLHLLNFILAANLGQLLSVANCTQPNYCAN